MEEHDLARQIAVIRQRQILSGERESSPKAAPEFHRPRLAVFVLIDLASDFLIDLANSSAKRMKRHARRRHNNCWDQVPCGPITGQRLILNGYQEPELLLLARCSLLALFDTVSVMTRQDEPTPPVALNDGMGGSERNRVIEVPEMASLYIECLGPMGQAVSRATGFVVRDEKARPYLVTNRHVVTGRNSLDGNQPILDRDGRAVIAPSALRVAMPSRERPGVWVWKPCVYDLGDNEYKPTWLEHPDLGWKVDVIALPIHVDDEAFDPPPVPMTPFPAQLRIATKEGYSVNRNLVTNRLK